MRRFHPALHRLAQCVPLVCGGVFFAIALWRLWQEFQTYRLADVLQSLGEISHPYLLGAIALTICNYTTLAGYDLLAIRYIRHPLAVPKTMLAGFVSYAISNSVGFTLLSGSAVRYHFYSRWGLSAGDIVNVIAFCNLSFWVGLCAVGGVMFLIEPADVPDFLHLPIESVHPLGVVFLSTLLGYFVWNMWGRGRSLRIGGWVIPHLPLRLSLMQITVTVIDWLLSAGSLYVLLPHPVPLSYLGFFDIFLLAQVSGILSNVPGGLGVFETVMLVLLPKSITPATLLGTLLAFRGIYYFLPLAIALLSFGFYEWRHRCSSSKP